LHYTRYEGGALLANGVIAVVALPLGTTQFNWWLMMAMASFFGTNVVTVEVLTPAE
jgi:hypothetical protein